MGFLDNDLVNKAKDQYGGQAADEAQQVAGKFIGDDAAGGVIGGLSGALGIQRTATATAGGGAQDTDSDAQDSDQSDSDDDGDDSADDDNS